MENKQLLRGLCLATANIYAADHKAAIKWHSNLLDIKSYFNVPGNSESRLGDYQHELGIINSAYALTGATQTSVLLPIGMSMTSKSPL